MPISTTTTRSTVSTHRSVEGPFLCLLLFSCTWVACSSSEDVPTDFADTLDAAIPDAENVDAVSHDAGVHDVETPRAFGQDDLSFVVGPPRLIIRTWQTPDRVHVGDSNFVALKSDGADPAERFLGYSGHGTTYLFTGQTIESLRLKTTGGRAHEVIAGGSTGHFDECGAWLSSVERIEGQLVGLYHAERSCNYYNGNQSLASVGYAVSTDRGYTFEKPDYPNNVVLEGYDTDNSQGGFRGLAGGFTVALSDSYYTYFTELTAEGWFPGLARTRLAVPGDWSKFGPEGFTEAGRGGVSVSLELPGNSVGRSTRFKSFLSLGARRIGVAQAISSDGIHFTDWTNNPPLLPAAEQDWKRTHSLGVRPTSNSGFADQDYTFDDSAASPLGYVFRKRFPPFTADLYYCQRSVQVVGATRRPDKYFSNSNTCSIEGVRIPTARIIRAPHQIAGTYGNGDVFAHLVAVTQKDAFLRHNPWETRLDPLYQCEAQNGNLLLGRSEHCGNLRHTRGELLGYLRSRRSGELYAYPSIVAPEGGRTFDSVFYVFYSYIRPGNDLDRRLVTVRRVTLTERVAQSPVQIALSQYHSTVRADHWATIELPTEEYAQKGEMLGYVHTKALGPTSVPLFDCVAPSGKHIARAGGCGAGLGESVQRQIGFVFSDPREGRTALYRCYDARTNDSLLAITEHCGLGLETRSTRLGYVETVSPAADAAMGAQGSSPGPEN